MAIYLPKKKRHQPLRLARINWKHPRAKGLTSFVVNFGGVFYDLVAAEVSREHIGINHAFGNHKSGVAFDGTVGNRVVLPRALMKKYPSASAPYNFSVICGMRISSTTKTSSALVAYTDFNGNAGLGLSPRMYNSGDKFGAVFYGSASIKSGVYTPKDRDFIGSVSYDYGNGGRFNIDNVIVTGANPGSLPASGVLDSYTLGVFARYGSYVDDAVAGDRVYWSALYDGVAISPELQDDWHRDTWGILHAGSPVIIGSTAGAVPIAVDDAFAGGLGGQVVVSAPGVLANDTYVP